VIAITGCGPAGLSAALLLHDAGYSVKLFEQFEQPGPVGSGLMLQPTGLAVLQQLGLRDRCEQLGQRIDRMSGELAPGGKVVLDIRYSALHPQLYGIAIHRASLFDVLYRAVQARNIPVQTSTTVASVCVDRISPGRPNVQLLDTAGNVVAEQLNLVVDASGAQSRLLAAAQQSHTFAPVKRRPLEYGALWTTVRLAGSAFERNCLEQRYKGASVMAGVLPCGTLPDSDEQLATLFWSIKASDYARWQSNGLKHWQDTLCSHWPELSSLVTQINDTASITHATYSHHTLAQPFDDSIVFIGDAAHATSPQLGQGANMALLDSWALRQAVRRSQSVADAGAVYAQLRRRHVRFYQQVSHWLTPFYQSDSRVLPWLRDTFFEPVAKLPGAAPLITRLGAGMMLSPIEKLQLQSNR
jgi:2-polyprenyl-6-methoxyphenol hydroxylase-like FAD-dependent oxidoreductase